MIDNLVSNEKLNFNVEKHKRAAFTRQNRFLRNKTGYTESKN